MKILPIRKTILDYVNGRNEKVLAAIFLLFFVFLFSDQNFIDQYPEIPDYDLNNPQDKMMVEFHKTSITNDELLAHRKFLLNKH